MSECKIIHLKTQHCKNDALGLYFFENHDGEAHSQGTVPPTDHIHTKAAKEALDMDKDMINEDILTTFILTFQREDGCIPYLVYSVSCHHGCSLLPTYISYEQEFKHF
jgi:hypothetical protein